MAATVQPFTEISAGALAKLIREDEKLMRLTDAVRQAADFRKAKTTMLPYVTPFGTFTRRRGDALVSLSGLIPVDIDGLESPDAAAEMRDILFEDKMISPLLTFVSPSRNGVKCFVPMPPGGTVTASPDTLRDIAAWQESLSDYIDFKYLGSSRHKVDRSGKDMARACFICHDRDAKSREYVQHFSQPKTKKDD